MSGNGNQVPLAPPRCPVPYPRASTPHMSMSGAGAECYHPGGTAGPSYMTGGNPAAPAQSMRAPSTPQPSAPPQPEMTKNNMATHNYVAPPNATAAARPQYSNFQYRAAQHSTRPATHNRQQQPYMQGSPGTAGGPVMYHPTLLFPTAHMSIPQGYQPRSTTPGYYPYMSYVYPNTNPGHTSPLTYSPDYYNGQGVGANAARPPGPLVPPAHQPQPQTHMPIPGIRQGPAKRTSRRVPIINPVTRQDIFSEDIFANESQNVSGESSERQTPQADSQSIVEEFTRMVSEAANESASETAKTNCVTKCTEVPAMADPEPAQPNAITCINNKSDIVVDNASDVRVETPVVSAISDSPIIVPKMTNAKHQKISENIIDNKAKPKAKKPNVPHETDKQSDAAVPATADMLPQPQRVREPRERVRPQEEKPQETKPNGPVCTNQTESINTSHIVETKIDIQNETKPESKFETETDTNKKVELVNSEATFPIPQTPTADQLLSSIEKVAQEHISSPETPEESDSVCLAQAKLTQSIASAARNNPDSMMKDINLNNTAPDPDTANGNLPTTAETAKEDMNKNEKPTKSSKKKQKNANVELNKNAGTESSAKETHISLNGKDETDNINLVESDGPKTEPVMAEQVKQAPPVFVPKHKYNEDQWSPLNPSGKKTYDINLLKQMKEDPLCKNKPNSPLLEACGLLRTVQLQDTIMSFNHIHRPANDSLFPTFLKTMSPNMRSPILRDNKKDTRNVGAPPDRILGKGSMKLNSPSSNSGGRNIYISLREEVKLNETKDAWKPTRLKRESLNEDELKTQELYKKFRGILNKLTPQKFDTLVDKVKSLEIDTQERLEGVIDLVFEKAIDEPNFSEAYAAMCNKLSTLKVPSTNSPDQCVNFRVMIISKCQNQFIKEKTDENVLKLEGELAECNDAAKKKELQLQLEEAQRRVRMRSVGNVRFIGELYKLKILISKIMVYCMNYLIEKPEEEKLECLCKLLTTIGEQVESEVKDQLDIIMDKMQDIVNDRKSNKISSRVRFMIQDVIELRRRKWVAKNVIDSQPKMMDQIQKEAEQQQRHIELMNSPIGGGFRRDEGGSGRKRGGEGRRQGNNFMDNTWKTTTTRTSYVVDTTKLKAIPPQKNLNTIKLAPHNITWNQGSGTKPQAVAAPVNNMYSILQNDQIDPTSLRGNKDLSPAAYQQSKSIERSTFNTRSDFASGGRSGSTGGARPTSTPTPQAEAPVPAQPTASPPPAVQEPLPEDRRKSIKQLVDLCIMNLDNNELVEEIKLFAPQYHAAVVTEIINVALEKNAKDIGILAKSVMQVVSSGAISRENLMSGMAEIFECGPDLYIDIPMLYSYLGKFIAPHIEKKNVTFDQVHKASKSLISANQGHLLLKAIIAELKDSMGKTFTKTKWQDSGLQLKQWMDSNMIPKWMSDNHFEFLESSDDSASSVEDTKRIMTPSETQSKLLQLMNSDESCDCLRGWVKDNIGASTGEEWFLRCLTQAICEHALFGPERSPTPHLSHDRMNKYSPLIGEYGDSQTEREAACLFGIQQLIHRLEHPQGLTLDIFQYLHEQYIISVDGFIAWETSEMEPEGKAVMLKALTSFFTSIREADNEDSCSEA